MNLYGFKCNFRGEEKGSFYHPQFFRGNWDTVKKIRRCLSHSQSLLQSVRLPDEDECDFMKNEDLMPQAQSPINHQHQLSPAESENFVISDRDDTSQCQASVRMLGSDMLVMVQPMTSKVAPTSIRVELGFKLPGRLTVVDSEGVSFHLTPPVTTQAVPASFPQSNFISNDRAPSAPVPQQPASQPQHQQQYHSTAPVKVAGVPSQLGGISRVPTISNGPHHAKEDRLVMLNNGYYEEIGDVWGDLGTLFSAGYHANH